MNLDAADPYEILGTTPDATETEVKVAAAKAKKELNPDHFPDGTKKAARQKLYRVREAERAILEDRPMDPTAGEPSGGAPETESSESETATATADLSVETDPDHPSVGVPVTFRVTDPADDPVANARIVTDAVDQPGGGSSGSGGQTARTDGGGAATLVFDVPGRRRVVATTDADAASGDDRRAHAGRGAAGNDREFRPAETSIVITRPTTTLSLEVDSETVTAGSLVSFRVVDDDGEPVRDASVAVAGETLSTDASGVASTTLHDSGSVRVRATKSESGVRYDPATATIRVTPVDEIDLVVTDDVETDRNGRLRVESDETITFEVRTEGTNRPVAGAAVAVEYAGDTGGRAGERETASTTTEADGRATVTFTESGRATVTATDGDIESAEIEVVVRRGDAGRRNDTETESVGIGKSAIGRLAARAVGLLVLVVLSGLIGLVVVSDEIPAGIAVGGGVAVTVGLLVYLVLVSR